MGTSFRCRFRGKSRQSFQPTRTSDALTAHRRPATFDKIPAIGSYTVSRRALYAAACALLSFGALSLLQGCRSRSRLGTTPSLSPLNRAEFVLIERDFQIQRSASSHVTLFAGISGGHTAHDGHQNRLYVRSASFRGLFRWLSPAGYVPGRRGLDRPGLIGSSGGAGFGGTAMRPCRRIRSYRNSWSIPSCQLYTMTLNSLSQPSICARRRAVCAHPVVVDVLDTENHHVARYAPSAGRRNQPLTMIARSLGFVRGTTTSYRSVDELFRPACRPIRSRRAVQLRIRYSMSFHSGWRFLYTAAPPLRILCRNDISDSPFGYARRR